MTDAGFSLFQFIAAIILTLINAGCLTALYYPFITSRKHHISDKIPRCVLIYALYCAVSAVGIVVPRFGIIGIICVAFFLGLSAPVLKLNRLFSAYLSIIFFCFYCQAGLIGNSILYLLNTRFAYGKHIESALRNTTYNYICVYVAETALLIFLIALVNRKILKTELKLNYREMSYLCIVPLIGILFGELVNRLLFIVKDGVIFSIYADYPVFLMIIPIIAVLFCIGVFAVLLSYQEMVKLQGEKSRFFVLEQQAQIMRERIDEVEQFYSGIRKMRHEMRNHLTNIKGLIKGGNFADIEQYISKMDDSMGQFELSEKTGNPVLDVIVNDKKNSAERSGIDFRPDFSFPVSDKFNAYDIGIIVNNLLTNALEACERMGGSNRYIYLSSVQNKKFYMIEVSNSYEGILNLDKDSGLPVSSKEDTASLHGLGLSIVRETAQKYMGDIDIKIGQDEFCVAVLLQETSIE